MNGPVDSILHLLACPDDEGRLSRGEGGLHCQCCRRVFPIIADNLIELLPARPTSLPESVGNEYRQAYLELFREPIRTERKSIAWGAEEEATASWVLKRLRQVRAAIPLITKGVDPGRSVLCDLSAGAGYYTFSCSAYFRWVLHCDLSPANLNYCRAKAQVSNSENIIFLRTDYFRTPFKGSLDRVICFDTLIRGEDHDRLLLNSIMQSMRASGGAIVDFHNWWHNPFRRVGLLKQNFISNKSYSRQAADCLLYESGVMRFAYRPFHQEFTSNGVFANWCKHFIPPTRLMYFLANSD